MPADWRRLAVAVLVVALGAGVVPTPAGAIEAVTRPSLPTSNNPPTPNNNVNNLNEVNIAATFARFVREHRRPYAGNASEYARRLAIFRTNAVELARFNAPHLAAGEQPVYGINKFADLSAEERQQLLLSPPRPPRVQLADACTLTDRTIPCNSTVGSPPAELDWREQHIISAITDQGVCGACWAFSSTATVETARALAGFPLTMLSTQQVLSCYGPPGVSCKTGGYVKDALDSIVKLKSAGGGLVPSTADPYKCQDGCPNGLPACPYPRSVFPNTTTYATINDTCFCDFRNLEQSMKSFIAEFGPMSVDVDANTWYGYTGGIMQHHCTDTLLNHAVQVIGYSADSSYDPPLQYWWVKNSWGTDWGESGYMRLAIGGNLCGIAHDVSLALADPAPSS